MDAEKYNYQQYEGLQKEERRKRITEVAKEPLETKRFLLSRNPELKKRIRILQKIVDEFKKQYPEIISLNLFGSLVKGYGSEESDFDAQLFIDKDKGPKGFKRYNAYNEFVKAIQKATKTEDIQVEHILVTYISKEEIIKEIKKPYFKIKDLFLLSTSRDINQYREKVLNILESKGKIGEEIWKNIMDDLWKFENKGLSDELKEKRKKLYPQTIADGRKYFLQEYK